MLETNQMNSSNVSFAENPESVIEDNVVDNSSSELAAEETGKGKSKAQEEFANLHPLRARLYDNVHLSLNTMNIVVAVVAILLLVVFFVGVATGSGINLN